jgi:hypothetical protein
MRTAVWQTMIVCVMFWVTPEAQALDVAQLEDLTGGAVPLVSLKQHDNFSNEYIYSVKVKNQTGAAIVGGTLIVVLAEVLDLTGKDALPNLQVMNQSGVTGGKPYFLVPTSGVSEVAAYQETDPIIIRVRSPDYVLFFPPTLRVLGLRRLATQNLEVLLQQLRNKGVLSDAEVQQALQPAR